jgi:hypothetical protein
MHGPVEGSTVIFDFGELVRKISFEVMHTKGQEFQNIEVAHAGYFDLLVE